MEEILEDTLRRARTPLLVLIAFTCANLVPTGVTLGLSIYLPRYFAKHAAVEFAAVGVAFSVVRVIDILLDPALGMLMDRTRTRFGRYRPWMIGGAPVLMIAIYMLFMAGPAADQIYLIGWLLVFYAGTSIFLLSQSAWAGVLSRGYAERARIFGLIQVMGLLGSVVVLVAPKVLGADANSDVDTMHLMGWTMIALTPVLTLTAALATPEPRQAEHAHDRPRLRDYWILLTRPAMVRLVGADLASALVPASLMPIYIFFWHDARAYSLLQTNMLLLASMGAGLIGAPFWGWIGGRIGKHVALIAAVTGFAVSNIIIVSIPAGNYAPVFAVQACEGFFAAAFSMLVRAMVADIADLTRLELGRERSGLLFSLVTSTSKIGNAISIGITFSLLQMLGYNPSGANTPEHMHGLTAVYTWVPVLFGLAGIAFLWRYPLTAKRHAEIRAALDILDRQSSAASGAAVQAASGELTGAAQADRRLARRGAFSAVPRR